MAIQYAEWGKFDGAWFAVKKTDLDTYLTYRNEEESRDVPIGFLELEEAQEWLKTNRPKQFRLVYIEAETIKTKWGYRCVVVYDADPDWVPGEKVEEETVSVG